MKSLLRLLMDFTVKEASGTEEMYKPYFSQYLKIFKTAFGFVLGVHDQEKKPKDIYVLINTLPGKKIF